ncbi:MAG: T9SS type A sorting domain-containing protein [Candidatus Eisenbacteria bacterium]|nr:T9SS type A sorting domain-containing protein [Candidatus Eisenbacteria bacterium]
MTRRFLRHTPPPRRPVPILSILGLLLILAGIGMQPAPAAAAAEVLSPREVLARATVEEDGRLYLVTREGTRVRLITDPLDPEITNRGDGAFHPADSSLVARSLAAIPARFTRRLDQRIYILPYPRSGQLRSTAQNRTVYLSPGMRPLTENQVAFLTVHETGHVVHQQFLPDSDADGWGRYRALRGIEDTGIYHAGASHPDRPHEIFAEDFRLLFGGAAAQATPHENGALPDPRSVPGLADFMESLLSSDVVVIQPAPLMVAPNPFRPGQQLRFQLPVSGRAMLEIHDVQGRRLIAQTIESAAGAGFSWRWDGRDALGRELPSGTYFVRVAAESQGSVGRVILVR